MLFCFFHSAIDLLNELYYKALKSSDDHMAFDGWESCRLQAPPTEDSLNEKQKLRCASAAVTLL